ncbi:MAG: asparaginase domain-containing protein [Steroidobacteraceae bacterium]
METIAIFTTGGTIDKVYFDAKGGYEVGTPVVRQVLEHARAEAGIPVTELLRKDSLEMTAADRAAIRAALAAAPQRRLVVTHGTDTMVETARALADLAGKVIVLTGALQPGRFSDSDAPFNLGMALAAAQLLPPGVYIAANGRVFDARRVRKNLAANRFEEVAG